MSTKKRILLVYAHFSTFVKQDYEILSEDHEVTRYHFVHSKKPLAFLWQFVKQLFYLLFKGWRYDAFFIWFADYHSLLPVWFAKITRKKSLVVIGGYDVCRIPEFKYGSFYKKTRGFFTIQTIKNCTINLTVSNSVDRKIRFIAPDAQRYMIYNCIGFKRPNDNMPLLIQNNREFIITVGLINNEKTFYIKGIDTFIGVARALPQFKFFIIGIDKLALSKLLVDLPSNLSLIERVDHNELAKYYLAAKIYCQFSLIESFCLALAESMYFNCIPVITRVGGMPEVTRGLGAIVKSSPSDITAVITRLMYLTEREVYHKHVEKHFSYNVRKTKLLKYVDGIFDTID